MVLAGLTSSYDLQVYLSSRFLYLARMQTAIVAIRYVTSQLFSKLA